MIGQAPVVGPVGWKTRWIEHAQVLAGEDVGHGHLRGLDGDPPSVRFGSYGAVARANRS